VLPLTRIFPCSKEIVVLARNLIQGNKIYKEMARKNKKFKEIARISVTYTSYKYKTTLKTQ
jgi:TRAP-type mannitol/chloroaromatic compound transport system substrate-binding protein